MEALLVGSSVLILFVILLRATLGKRISFRMRYALWLIVVLRLACPFALPGSPVSVMNYVPSVQTWFDQNTEQSEAGRGVSPTEAWEAGGAVNLAGAWEAGGGVGLAGTYGYGRGLSEKAVGGAAGQSARQMIRQSAVIVHPNHSMERVLTQDASVQTGIGHTQDEAGLQNMAVTLQAAALQSRMRMQGTAASQDLVSMQGEAEPRTIKAGILRKAMLSVWAAGSALMGLYLLAVNLIFYRKLRKARTWMEDITCAGRGGAIPVYQCGKLASSCLFGVWHPAVYLNGAALADEKNRAFALAHERQHYLHGDHIWSLVRLICLTVYWFHPFVWAAAYFSAKDCEFACDEGVTARITEEECADYGRSLLDQAPLKRGAIRLTATASMSGSARALKQRLLAVTGKKKRSAWAAVLAAAMLVLITGCTFTGADSAEEIDPAARTEMRGNGQDGSTPNAGMADYAGTDNVREADEALLARLEESIEITADGKLVFTIPESDHLPEDWSVLISEKKHEVWTSPAFSMDHKIEVAEWEIGKSIPIAEAEDVLSTTSMMTLKITLSSVDDQGEQVQSRLTIDLVERSRELSEQAQNAAGNTMLRACAVLADGQYGWALTEDYHILHFEDGTGRFSVLGSLPFAIADEWTGSRACFLEGSQVTCCFLDEEYAYYAGFSSKPGEIILIRELAQKAAVVGSENGRALITRRSTRIPVTESEYFPMGTVYVSFSDTSNGYLLICSDPACGLMEKYLYRTTDGGNSFSFVADLGSVVSGYPTGIAFCNGEVGYIGVSPRSGEDYLYCTRDGGETWESVSVAVYSDARYADGFAPVFYGEDGTQGALVLKCVGDDIRYVLYQNTHAAESPESWILTRLLPYEDVQGYSFVNADTGYFIDGNGMLQEWYYEFP
ncbi:MAG: M56 family metallopeptidase [Clostridium sp.]|nr:M56 family metallopeptidase [Clostridium sp.]